MSKIALLKSSSTHLAIFLSLLIGIAFFLIIQEIIFILGPEVSLVHMWTLWVKIGLLSTVCIGLFAIGFYVTKRINTICQVADDIMKSGDLSQRIPVENKWDDLSTLSLALNNMLSEIEQLMQGVRQVSDNIAHDLRTPLARLRNDLEDTRKAVSTEDDSQLDVRMEKLLGEADHLMQTFSALLRIGNIEGGKRHSGFGSVNLSKLLEDVNELYEAIAADKKQSLTLAVECENIIHGDKDLLFQAIANVVDNAIKYTPEGGEIHILQHLCNGKPCISISDSGVGVVDTHKEKLFRRFFRVEECRHTAGSGLGLALVHAVIQLHKGTVTLADNTPSGLIVQIRI